MRRDVLEMRDALREDLSNLLDVLDADLAACLHGELAPLVLAFEDMKARAGKLDFLDLYC